MTTLLEIKPYIFNFVCENLALVFTNKVYWLGERKNIPEYPYCLLNVIAENKDKRTSTHPGAVTEILESGEIVPTSLRENIVTRYKTCVITIGVYNGWVEDTADNADMDAAKEFAYEQIDYLEGCFEEYPINDKFSVQSISPIRPLHEIVDGGYMYRYEFDVTIGYNEERVGQKDVGQGVKVDIDIKDTEIIKSAIDFIVTVDGNDNIVIETNKGVKK